MRSEYKKGSSLTVVQTRGRDPGAFDLFDIRGLSLGKLHFVHRLLTERVDQHPTDVLALEILSAIGPLPQAQTVMEKPEILSEYDQAASAMRWLCRPRIRREQI
jgi:hypothetical protein